ncbi:MAG: WhiB family transcriptional regulator [Egibacteraceae bacterium]
MTSAGSTPPPPRADRRPWQSRAACLDADVELFFPIGTTELALDQIERAKATCARCEVRVQCLEWAIQTRQHSGIWGGQTAEERHATRRLHEARTPADCADPVRGSGTAQ